LRRSYWIAYNGFNLGRRSRRFVVEAGDRRREIASLTAYLLVLDGCRRISTSALSLASEDNVTIALILKDRMVWFTGMLQRKHVELILTQYSTSRAKEIASCIREAFNHNLYAFFSRLNLPFEAEGGLGKVRVNALKLLSRYLRVDLSLIESVIQYLSYFIEAECLDAVVRAGLTPHIGFVNKRSLTRDFLLVFEPSTVWRCLVEVGSDILSSIDLGSYEGRRLLLKYLRSIVERSVEDTDGRRMPLFKHIKAAAKGLASYLMNPAGGFIPFKEAVY